LGVVEGDCGEFDDPMFVTRLTRSLKKENTRSRADVGTGNYLDEGKFFHL
jgi:hypothetical protein